MAETQASRPLIQRVIAWVLKLRIVRAFLLYSTHRGPLLADGVTYRALFSIFAGVLLGFSLAALWLAGNPEAWRALVDAVDAVIPGLIGTIVDPAEVSLEGTFTTTGIISLVALIGAAIGAIMALRTALRVIADEVVDDVFWLWVILRNLALAVGIGAALAATAALTMLLTAGAGLVHEWLGLPPEANIWGTRLLQIGIVYVLDTVIIAVLFAVLSGVKAPWRTLWGGAMLGGLGLIVLQELSGLFVGGATSNPLLATFASLIALLLWVNLSSQVILIASAFIVTGVRDQQDHVRFRHGASTFAQLRVQQAEDAVRTATDELHAARDAEAEERKKEREKQLEQQRKEFEREQQEATDA